MIPIIHKVNSIDKLKNIPKDYGVEIDIRNGNSGLILSHEPANSGVLLEDYLDKYNNNFLIANIKESGIENEVVKTILEKNVENFFLLDVEFPYIYQNSSTKTDFLSTRFSKYESIESVENLINKVSWLWVDTYDNFRIDNNSADIMKNFKICMVSPSRWGSPESLNTYIDKFKEFSIEIDAVMIEYNENFNF
tara:strand:+ start:1733 stop:2311 length:579 start_codon:yes stop_codon:yes gene_type:complete